MIQIESPELKRPGGPVYFKPIKIDGVFYRGDKPPKILTDVANRETQYIGGEVISRDEAYSIMFWEKNKNIKNLKQTMIDIIKNSIATKEFSIFVGGEKTDHGFVLDQDSKEKLSAYRILALELGYKIDKYIYNENTGIVVANIGNNK